MSPPAEGAGIVAKVRPSTTRVSGRYAIRPCFVGARTSMADVDRLVARAREIGDELQAPALAEASPSR